MTRNQFSRIRGTVSILGQVLTPNLAPIVTPTHDEAQAEASAQPWLKLFTQPSLEPACLALNQADSLVMAVRVVTKTSSGSNPTLRYSSLVQRFSFSRAMSEMLCV